MSSDKEQGDVNASSKSKVHEKASEQERLDLELSRQVAMSGDAERLAGRRAASGAAAAVTIAQREKDEKRRKSSADDMILLDAVSDPLFALERNLKEKYGEDFALQWAEELLGEEALERIRAIKDPGAQRREIAKEINKGLEDGSIDRTRIQGNTDLQEWLDQRRAEEEKSFEAAREAARQAESGEELEVSHQTSYDANQLASDSSVRSYFNTLADESYQMNTSGTEELDLLAMLAENSADITDSDRSQAVEHEIDYSSSFGRG